jgi:demethylmenaquinone methyltransferase/2-methoxy-6-polyprenyl-1,4-benzoquinol methylase
MTASADRVQGIFNRIAPVYDDLNDWLSFGLHRVWKQMTVKWSGAKPGDRALDLCCGSGDLALRLAAAVGPGGQVVGADFSAQMLDRARERPQGFRPLAPIAWVEADALNLPFADREFDCATVGYGLRNVTDFDQALRELYRVLKPGATLAALDFHRPDSAIAQQFQQLYLDRLVVPVAQQFGATAEYEYILPSLQRFPVGREQVERARAIGFRSVRHYPLVGGLMGVLVATKP